MASYDLQEQFREVRKLARQAEIYDAVVASGASTSGGSVQIVIPGFDGGRQKWNVDFWSPREGDFPKKGNPCVVALTATHQVILLGWMPGGGGFGPGTRPGGGGPGSEVVPGDIASGTPKHIIDDIVLPTAAANGITKSVAQNDADNAAHGSTGSGNLSDHEGPPDQRWAADISNSSGTSRTVADTTPQMDAVALALARQFGVNYSPSGGIFARHYRGYRYQLIYRIDLGADGNHFNHVHFGVERE